MNLTDARALAESARQHTSAALEIREGLPDIVDALADALELARSLRLARPDLAVDPAVHTPHRVLAYLAARGWAWSTIPSIYNSGDGRRSVHVHGVATASDYTARTGLLVSDLASIYGTGELQVLADIAEAGDE